MARCALFTGAKGQDGGYLAEFLQGKSYEVDGIRRRASSLNTERIDHLFQDPRESDGRFCLRYGDLVAPTNLIPILQDVQTDEIYDRGEQSHVRASLETPEHTANSDALGTFRVLEAIRVLRLEDMSRLYQASTSELYGNSPKRIQDESTPCYPRSPYGAGKLSLYSIACWARPSSVRGSGGCLEPFFGVGL